MTVVFVHGVPETAAVWDALRMRLDRDSVALSLPGFGSPLPAGFEAKEDWERWLVAELEAMPGPVDLVGHDWGSLLALRIATAHGDLVRSWAVDVASVSHPDYAWHDFARLWQTPGEGEAWMRATLDTGPDDPAGFFGQLPAFGIGTGEAKAMGAAFDEAMAESILRLYRSAQPNVHADWAWTTAQAPGLVLRPTADPFDDPALAADVAARLGATVRDLPGLGHFWMLQDPAAGAEAVRAWVDAR
ncbi:alpha/beta hydrolase [Pseudonocardia sp. RS11V-5]|uniref:alpha/beta fold hydrolase n=1 Tax=Pseudonocardia terrae TaxID=2905831 RepID=UPI001E620184|nr:alpha/beta hydrolase [Pseudonocardia terrae]MCE3552885.1 alpha/beta hydrolase [Pseudonocardia terrae]